MAQFDAYSSSIYSGDVRDRIDELQETDSGYDVVRVRNGEVIETFGDEEDASEFLDKEDYDPQRVVVQARELDDEDQRELDSLRSLADDADSTLGAPWTIEKSENFGSDWARGEAEERLGRSVDLDSWPLSEIDWSEAAETLLGDRDYVDFDGETWYEA